jgi:hypothetical protein
MPSTHESDSESTGSWVPVAHRHVIAGSTLPGMSSPVPPFPPWDDFSQTIRSEQIPIYLSIEHGSAAGQVLVRLRITDSEAYQPRTPLAEKLMALRRQAIDKGMRLLTWDEVDAEVRRRRGDRSDDE